MGESKKNIIIKGCKILHKNKWLEGHYLLTDSNGLIKEIEGLRPIYLGPSALAYLVEMSTPLLLNAMIINKMKNPGIKII